MVTLDQAGRARGWTRFLAPPASLEPFVELLWTQRDTPADVRGVRWRIVPDAAPHLIVRRMRRTESDTAASRSRTAVTLVGARAHHVDNDLPERAWTAGVRFRPGALPALTGLPGSALSNRGISASTVFGSEGQRLEHELESAQTPRDALETVHRTLQRILRDATAPDLRVRGLMRMVTAYDREQRMTTPGVRMLADRLGIAERTLRQACADSVGLSPVRIVRVSRLHHALEIALAGGADGGWATIAVRTGYFDQSHLIRDFGVLLGETPSDFLDRAGIRQHSVRRTSPI